MASGPWTFSTIAALGQRARHLGPHARRSRRQDLRGRKGICTFTLNSGIWMGLNARNLDPARDGAGVRTFMRHNGIRTATASGPSRAIAAYGPSCAIAALDPQVLQRNLDWVCGIKTVRRGASVPSLIDGSVIRSMAVFILDRQALERHSQPLAIDAEELGASGRLTPPRRVARSSSAT